jgi:PAS domain S-box-containing protein
MNSQITKTILLVEDMAIIAMAEANTLKKNGFEVIVAYNGNEAIKQASENPNLDLILMDIDLGKGMDGPEAAQIILKHREIPIVFLSNHTEKEVVEKTEKITSYGYVVKNSGETVLIASIKMAFKLFEAHHQVRESELKLLESDKKFHNLEKQIDDVIWTMDMNFRFTYMSPSVEKMHGYTTNEMMKLNLQDYLTPESTERTINALAEQINSFLHHKLEKNIVTIQLDQIKKDGTVFPTEIIARFLLDEDKNPAGIIGVTRDISERQKSREALLESKKALDLALEGAQIGFWDSNYITGKVFRSEIWASMLGYTLEEVENTSDFWRKHIHPDDFNHVIEEVEKHEAGTSESFSVEHRIRTKSGEYKWILDWGKVFERTENGKPIRAMGVHIDIDKRVRIEKDLLETNKTLNLALEGAQIGLWDQDFVTGKVIRTEYWAKMLGYDLNEIEKNLDIWKSFIHPDDYDLVMKAASEHEQGLTENFKVQHRLKCKDGNYKWILNWGKISERDVKGNPKRAVGIHLDVDDRVKTEEALRESEYRFRTLFETMTLGIVYQNNEGKIISANPAALRILGLTFDQMQGRTSIDPRWKSVHEDGSDFPGENHPAMMALKTGKPVENVVMGIFHPHRNEYLWINITAIPLFIKSSKKPYQVYAMFEDISERKLSERNLIQSEQRLRYALEATSDGIWELNIKTNQVYFSPTYYTLLGFKPNEFVRSYNTWKNLVHPADLEFVEKVFLDAINSCTPYSSEYRIKNKAGNYIWVLGRGKVTETDSEGKALRISGSIYDITKSKLAQDSLKKSQEMLRHILEQFPGVVFWKDKDSRYIGCNQAFASGAGLNNPEEIVGKTDFDLPWANSEAQNYIDDDKQVMESEQSKLNIEETQHQSNNEIKWFNTNKVPLLDSLGNIIGILGTSSDITERRMAEELLRNSEANLNSLVNNRNEAIWSIDNNYNFIFVNNFFKQDFLRVFGTELKKGMNALSLLTSEQNDFWKPKYDKALAGENLVFEFSNPFSNEIHYYEVSLSPISSDGETMGVSALSADITKKKKAEEEILQRKEELERFEKIVVGRELKMIELKEKITELELKLKETKKYE